MRVCFQFFFDGWLVLGAPGIGEFSSQIFRVCRCFLASFVHRQVISDLGQIFDAPRLRTLYGSVDLVSFLRVWALVRRLSSVGWRLWRWSGFSVFSFLAQSALPGRLFVISSAETESVGLANPSGVEM